MDGAAVSFFVEIDGFGSNGVTGLKALGVRDLTYRIAFLALFIKPAYERDDMSVLRDEQVFFFNSGCT